MHFKPTFKQDSCVSDINYFISKRTYQFINPVNLIHFFLDALDRLDALFNTNVTPANITTSNFLFLMSKFIRLGACFTSFAKSVCFK